MSRLLACIAASLLAISCAPFAAQRQPAASSPSPVPPGPLKLLPSGTFDATPERTSAHPPDAAIAAGRSELIVSLNSDISIRDKSGALIASSRPGKFYGYAPMPPTDERESIADPRAVYDRESNRFFLLSGASTENAPPCTPERCFSHFLLAVSKDSAPKTLTDADWYLYALPMTREFPPHTVQLIDFPSLSVSGGLVVLTANMLLLLPGATSGKPYQKVRLIEKASLLKGREVDAWTDLDDLKDPDSNPAHNLQPVVALGTSTPTFLAGFIQDRCQFALWAISGTAGKPAVRSRFVPSSLRCERKSPPAAQPGGGPPLEVDGPELVSHPVYRDGYLWLAHTMSQQYASETVAAVGWAQIDVRKWPNAAALVQESLLTVERAWICYPALVAGPRGAMAMVFAESSLEAPERVAYTGRFATDPRSSLRPARVLKQSGASQDSRESSDAGRNRFGDYFDIAADPVNDTIWIVGEYVRTSREWGMTVGHVEWSAG